MGIRFILICILICSCSTYDNDYQEFELQVENNISCRMIYEDGKLSGIEHFNNFNKEVLSNYYFYSDGMISRIESMSGDTILSVTDFYSNGKIENKFKYKLSPLKDTLLFHGEDTYYFANGRLKSIGEWANGLRKDTFKYYNDKGELLHLEYYNKDGHCNGPIGKRNYQGTSSQAK